MKKNYFRNYFFSTFRKITVGGFVNQLLKKSSLRETKALTLFFFCIVVFHIYDNLAVNSIEVELK